MPTTTGVRRSGRSPAGAELGRQQAVEGVHPVDGIVGMEARRWPTARRPRPAATEPGRRMARTRSTASADDAAPVPTHTIRDTPASAARAMVPASRVACGSAAGARSAGTPSSRPNSSWRWQWESNHSITASCTERPG